MYNTAKEKIPAEMCYCQRVNVINIPQSKIYQHQKNNKQQNLLTSHLLAFILTSERQVNKQWLNLIQKRKRIFALFR